ncbi:BTB/POZ and MATH domain-containing protein 2-like [Aegilops tauschii subsp. strangulata]|uniref:BTB/POZ and MATH domain-containing protein 2-like n=1 Tax=Aegilops tauschii subsp. strangulata TaxID=200361 RepID=UPI00098BCC74|nr:BTB/POZ and MATH domain-containing protein 2-like [Aegilops tauschii subsp. strangulata]
MGNVNSGLFLHGECQSETSSTCFTESAMSAHNFVVRDYPLLEGIGAGEFVSSSTFNVGGYAWTIKFYPDGEQKDKSSDMASCYLYCASQANNRYVQKSTLRALSDANNGRFTIRCVLQVIHETRTVRNRRPVEVPPPSLMESLEHMLKDGEGADVTFSVRDQLFRAHRCVLAARSQVFKAELFGPMKESKTGHIMVDDMEPQVFEALLHFMYTDAMPDDDEDEGKIVRLQHLLVAADRYGVDRLKIMCEDKLHEGIDVDTVATTLLLAEQHHCEDLKEACIQFISSPRDKLSAVMATDGFKQLVVSCPLLMEDILKGVSCT